MQQHVGRTKGSAVPAATLSTSATNHPIAGAASLRCLIRPTRRCDDGAAGIANDASAEITVEELRIVCCAKDSDLDISPVTATALISDSDLAGREPP